MLRKSPPAIRKVEFKAEAEVKNVRSSLNLDLSLT